MFLLFYRYSCRCSYWYHLMFLIFVHVAAIIVHVVVVAAALVSVFNRSLWHI